MKQAGATIPTTVIHYIPSGATVNATSDYWVNVTSASGTAKRISGDFMQVRENDWYDEENPAQVKTLPWATCLADTGCSVGVTAKQQVFLSDPLESVAPSATAGGYTPVFSVRQISYSTWVGTLGAVGSFDSVTTVMEKDDVNPDQQINFSFVSNDGGTGPGVNMYMTDKADLRSENAVLYYSGIATASQQLASMTLTPRIWKKEPSGDVLVYSGKVKTCTNAKDCRVNGTFIPLWDISNITATYCANVSTWYTMSPELIAADDRIPHNIIMEDDSQGDEPVPEVIVTGPLSPVPPGTSVSAENVNNSVPWGGMVEHAMNGDVPTTVVYDANGQPQYRANDLYATIIDTPAGVSTPATHMFSVPNGSFVHAQQANQTVTTLGEERVFTVLTLDNTFTSDNRSKKTTVDATPSTYLESCFQDGVQLDQFTAKWTVPSSPTSFPSYRQYTFPGIQGTNAYVPGEKGIIQPVLEWRGKWQIKAVAGPFTKPTSTDNGNYYSADAADTAVGNKIAGSLTYQNYAGSASPTWTVYIQDQTTMKTSSFSTDLIRTNQSLKVYAGALEEYNMPNDDDKTMLMGNLEYHDMSYKYLGGTDVPITLQPATYPNVPANILKHLQPVVVHNPDKCSLKTQQ